MSKRVRLTLELDAHFIRLLNANMHLSGLMKDDGLHVLDVRAVLARVVLAEARGAPSEQVHALTPVEWRGHIDVLPDERQVFEDAVTAASERRAPARRRASRAVRAPAGRDA